MAIDWKLYLSAIVAPFASLLQMSADNLVTSKVSQARLDAAQILDGMRFEFNVPAVVDAFGFALTIRANQKVYVVLYRTSEKYLLSSSYTFAQEIGLIPVAQPDAFLLFLIQSLNLSVQATPSVEQLKASLKHVPNSQKVEIDFDAAASYYGKFVVWEAAQAVKRDDLLALLCSGNQQYFLHFAESASEFGIENYARGRIVNLNAIALSSLKPIFTITDSYATTGSIIFNDVTDLQDAMRLALQGVKDVVLGPQSRAYFDYEDKGISYLCIPLSGLKDEELAFARTHLENEGAVEVELKPANVVAFSHLLQYSFLPSARFVNYPNQIIQDLDLGRHLDIYASRLSALFDEYYIFDISAMAEFSKWKLLCFLAVKFQALRSPFIRQPIIEAAERLSPLANAPVENIYLSLSASHWKHSFLEIYRLIEGLYYFGWMNKLRASLGSPLNEFALFKQCEKDTAWSYSDGASISSLFELIPVEVFSSCSINSIPCLKGRFDGKTKEIEVSRSFATALYSVRNSLVHQGLRNSNDEIWPTSHCWENLTLALFLAAEYLYSTHPLGMPPKGRQ